MAFQRKHPVRITIIINDLVLEQVSFFKFLACDLSFDYDDDLNNRLSRFQNMCATIRRTLKHRARKNVLLKFYKKVAMRTLFYGY
jgi:hypothetical protein